MQSDVENTKIKCAFGLNYSFPWAIHDRFQNSSFGNQYAEIVNQVWALNSSVRCPLGIAMFYLFLELF